MVCSRGLYVCTLCVLFRTDKQRKELCCSMGYVGNILADKSNMGDIRSHNGVGRKYENSNGNPIRYNKYHLLFYYYITLFKEDMAATALTWKILFTLGLPIWGGSLLMAWNAVFLDINWGDAPPEFKNTMYGLSCVVLMIFAAKGFVGLLHSIERLKADKAKNKYLNNKYNAKK